MLKKLLKLMLMQKNIEIVELDIEDGLISIENLKTNIKK